MEVQPFFGNSKVEAFFPPYTDVDNRTLKGNPRDILVHVPAGCF